MTDNITRAWEALNKAETFGIFDGRDLAAIRAVLPPKPEVPKHEVEPWGEGYHVVIGIATKAYAIPTRDQAERIAAIYNEEVGE